MALIDLKKFGKYKAKVLCSNCNFASEIKVPKGISVVDFIKEGSCKCDNCGVVGYPEEYTTEYFEKKKKQRNEVHIVKEIIKGPGQIALEAQEEFKGDKIIKW